MFSNDAEGEGSSQPLPRRSIDPRRRAQPFVLVPTARAFRPASAVRRDQGLAIPSRTVSPATSNATAGSGSIAGAGGGAGNVIDLTEDDDDVVEITGVLEPQARTRARRTVQNGPMWRDLRRKFDYSDPICAVRSLADTL